MSYLYVNVMIKEETHRKVQTISSILNMYSADLYKAMLESKEFEAIIDTLYQSVIKVENQRNEARKNDSQNNR